jgi:glutamine amidotransferase
VAAAVALIDYGAGNLHSVANALKTAGARDIAVTADPVIVAGADRIVLPGVGAFGACASALRGVDGMIEAIEQRVLRGGAPFLGICVGMQLMADAGEEGWVNGPPDRSGHAGGMTDPTLGEHPGLGWIKGRVRHLTPNDPAAKVPHMGWNDVRPLSPHPLIEAGEAYFLHSFAFEGEDVVATSDHAGPVAAAIARDNLAGVQFHPEKSQRYGLDLLARFLEWRP